MKRSHDPQVKNMIVINDSKFNTTKLKRTAGQHKQSYFTREQCLLLPQAIDNVSCLGVSYFGQLFGGRMIALKDLTPKAIDFSAHTIDFWESKVQKTVPKPIFEPETTFIRQFIMDMGIGIHQPLFPLPHVEYNRYLSATVKFFENTAFPLHWKPTTHTAFKHTCVTQMSLHGVRMDTISDYIGTDPNTLKQFYRGGSETNVKREIGGLDVAQEIPTWRAFVVELTHAYARRYEELTGRQVVLPVDKGAA